MFDAEEMEENQRNNAKLDAKELEQLLREGAYAVLLEDNNEEMKTFCEQDIESILGKLQIFCCALSLSGSYLTLFSYLS